MQVAGWMCFFRWLHSSRNLRHSKTGVPWKVWRKCTQRRAHKICERCKCAWTFAGLCEVLGPKKLAKGGRRSSHLSATHGLLQACHPSQFQPALSHCHAGAILANTWEKWRSSPEGPTIGKGLLYHFLYMVMEYNMPTTTHWWCGLGEPWWLASILCRVSIWFAVGPNQQLLTRLGGTCCE